MTNTEREHCRSEKSLIRFFCWIRPGKGRVCHTLDECVEDYLSMLSNENERLAAGEDSSSQLLFCFIRG